MSGSSSVAALLAFVVAGAGFAGVCITAPVGDPEDALWENGLVRDIVFEGSDFKAFNVVHARLIYRNLSDEPVAFNLTYPVMFAQYVDGKNRAIGGTGGEGDWEIITVPAGGEYAVCNAGFYPESAGWYEVEWNGMRRGIEVAKGEVVERIVTNKEEYRVKSAGGTASIEFYNPTHHNVTFSVPNTYDFKAMNPDGSQASGFSVSFFVVDWEETLPPGGTFRVYTFFFPTIQVGEMTLTVNDVSKTVEVVPRK